MMHQERTHPARHFPWALLLGVAVITLAGSDAFPFPDGNARSDASQDGSGEPATPAEDEAKADVDGAVSKEGVDEKVAKEDKDDEELSPEAKRKAALEEAKKKAAEKKAAKAKPKAGPGPGIAKAKAGGGGPSKKKGAMAGGFPSGGRPSTGGGYSGIGSGGTGGGASAALAGSIGVNLGTALQGNPVESDDGVGDPNISEELLELIRLVNAERRKAEVPELSLNDDLMEMAQDQSDRAAEAHSRSVLKEQHEFMVHDLFGFTFVERLKKAGYEAETAGENLGIAVWTPRGLVANWMEGGSRQAITGLLLTPEGRVITELLGGRTTFPREVLLNPAFREMGVGVARADFEGHSGIHQWTLVMARRKVTPATAETPTQSSSKAGDSDDAGSMPNE
jgi:uncharacterized protein YkwD